MMPQVVEIRATLLMFPGLGPWEVNTVPPMLWGAHCSSKNESDLSFGSQATFGLAWTNLKSMGMQLLS